MRKLLVPTLIATLALPVHARLGESEQETIARYGPLVAAYNPGQQNASYRTLAFNKNGYLILAIFIDSRCELVIFRKDDQGEFSRDDLDLILEANSNGQKWTPTPLASTDVFWDRPDGAMARYDTAGHALAICSDTYMRAESFRRKVERQKVLENF
jgi:hypothetical protein